MKKNTFELKVGLAEINKLCYKKAQHTYGKLIELNNVEEIHDRNLLNNFVLRLISM